MSKTTDFLKKVLFEYEDSLRQTGRTTRLVEQAKETGSVIVCHNYSWAHTLLKEYGVEAISLDTYLNNNYHRGKKPRKYLFDSPAEYQIIKSKLEEAEKIMTMGERHIW